MFKDIQTANYAVETKSNLITSSKIAASQNNQILSSTPETNKISFSRQLNPLTPELFESTLHQQDNSQCNSNKTKQTHINSCVVKNALLYIENNYFKDINIDTVALSVGVSRSCLVKQFKLATNETINNKIIEVRIEQAKKVLLKKSVTETAYEVGFNNSNYFATVFKKRTNCTPKQFKSTFTR
nr:helix-turn-helix transcriptional regulator [Pseudoalteromonas sp. SA25]